jgi:hypothetical protein
MKLWLSTANPLQRSRYGEISSPKGKKISIKNNENNENGIVKVIFWKNKVNYGYYFC